MTELELIKAARRGDRQAFASVLEPLQDKLFQTALGIVGNVVDAEDVWQSAVLQAWANLPRLRQPQYFRTWMTRILLNEAKQLLRRRAGQPLPIEALPELAEAPAAELEQRLLVERCLKQLPEAGREAILLRYWLELSLKEMAEVLRVPLGTAKTRLYQGQRALKNLIEEADR